MKRIKAKEIYVRWMGIPLVAVLAMGADPEDHLAEKSLLFQYFVALLFTATYWNGACFVIFRFRKLYPEISKTSKRLLLSSLGIILWLTVGGIPIKLLCGLSTVAELLSYQQHAQFLPFNFVAALVITLSYEAFYFFAQWKEQFRLNEQLKNQQIKTQYEVLQNQMSPHFLFNSLNTLASIIPEDGDAAVTFTEKLSEVYRYILQNKERELVRLEEELEFVKSYLFLLRIRYPDNLRIDYRIHEDSYRLNIPPLTLQMLVENAIKHNVVSRAKPLHLEIYVENNKSIVVKNNMQKKEVAEKSTQTGLENIRRRYQLLGRQNVDIISSAANFMVAVPLIDLMDEHDLSVA
ncbi:MAG: histidine kinase [Bacteroidota bacterium]